MTQVKSSFGTFFQVGDGAVPENFTTVAEVGDISGPSISRDTEEVTNHSSPNGYEEFITTIKRSGEVTFPINFIPTDPTHDQTTGILAWIDDGLLRNFRILISTTGKRWQFAALATNFEAASPVVGKNSGDVTLKISGKPTLV